MRLKGLSDLLGYKQTFLSLEYSHKWFAKQLPGTGTKMPWRLKQFDSMTRGRGGEDYIFIFGGGGDVRQRNVKFPSNRSRKKIASISKGRPDLLDPSFASKNHIFYISLHILIKLAYTRMFHECLNILDHDHII